MSHRLSLTVRLTVLFGLVSSVVLLGLGAVVASSLQSHFADQDRDVLGGKIMLVHHLVERVASPREMAALADEFRDAFIGHSDLAVKATSPSGEVLFESGTVRIPAPALTHAGKLGSTDIFEWDAGGQTYRGLAAAIQTAIPQAPPAIVAVAVDTRHHTMFLESFGRTLAAFVIAAALLSALLGWLAVRRGLEPVRAMREEAASVTANRLDRRLPVDSLPVELADLGLTLNEMLGRLEGAFQRLSEFSSDIAHELRTPISNLMTQTQVELSRERDSASYRDVLASNGEEFERLARMISDMLFLAKADHGLMLPAPEAITVEEEVDAVFEFFDALAEERGVRFEVSGAGTLEGDRSMLRRALGNLISNALRFARRGSSVVVRISPVSCGLQVTIENQGETIAPEHLPRLFDRFYRIDKSRVHQESEGTGLGLAITRAIVLAHGGEVSAASHAGLTCFTLSFPGGAYRRSVDAGGGGGRNDYELVIRKSG